MVFPICLEFLFFSSSSLLLRSASISEILLITVLGVMLFCLLYSICFFLLLSVSSIAYFIEPVIESAYNITLPSTCLAARPIVCTSDVFERK